VDSPAHPTNVDDFDAWHGSNAAKVHVESSEETPEKDGNPRRLFVIFNVVAPVFFPAANFGFPSAAPQNIRSEADTIQAPDVPDPTLSLPSFGDLAAIVPLLLIVAVVLAASKERKSREAWA
jgi:hypothetical protein